MEAIANFEGSVGVELANRLGLSLNRREGHDLAGPCIACPSSDAFRLHQETGVGYCFSCQGKWSPFRVAETVLGDRERVKALLVDIGIFQPQGNGSTVATDPITAVARRKGISVESLRAFGAQLDSTNAVKLPAYGPDGQPCTTFTLSVRGGKGHFGKDKPAGLFFPHIDGKVRLPQAGEIWHIVEGPKDAAALHELDLLSCGLNTCQMAAKFARLFIGVEVVLIPDRDRAGEEGAQFSARVLRGLAKSVRVAVLPAEFKESKGADVRDVLRKPSGREQILQAIADARYLDGSQVRDTAADQPTSSPQQAAQSQATLAANLAADWELWHTLSEEAYATIPANDHKENWPVRSKTTKQFVTKEFFDRHDKALGSEALAATINLFEARARFKGEEHAVHMRVAKHDGSIFLDLCNADWQAVQITPTGWEIAADSPVRFRRSQGMLPLPVPERRGNINLLREFLNLDDNAWRLVISWLIAALRPRGPYPILALFAEQGSGKSTIGRLLRELIDPNAAPLRVEPNDGRDLMITANNAWCLAFDNLSHLRPWLSDALCRLSTGGGFATRELYTDQDEVIFDSQRPVLLTSIEEVAGRSDLLDRCLIVELPTIVEERRRTEAELIEGFRKVRPRILGGLLDAVAVALNRLPTIKLPQLPRMADFAVWVSAAETSFGWPSGTFMTTYQSNRQSANEVALEASTISKPLLDLLETQGEWTGSSGDLLKALEASLGDQTKRLPGWPNNARSLSCHLKRLAPNLRAAGWDVERNRNAQRRSLSIRRLKNDATSEGSRRRPSSFASQTDERNSMPTDADMCNVDRDDGNDTNDTNDANAGRSWNPDRF